MGVYLRTGRLDAQGKTHVVATVVREGRPTVLLLDPAAALPAGDDAHQYIAADSFTVDTDCVSPLRTFQVRCEGKGAAFEDAGAPLRREEGQPAQLSFDLTWATDGTPYQWRLATRFPCRVSGSIVIDGERIEFEGVGQRDHSWGPRDWWQTDWSWSAFHLDDGTHLHTVTVPGLPSHSVGYVQANGHVVEATEIVASTDCTKDGLFGSTTIEVEPAHSAST